MSDRKLCLPGLRLPSWHRADIEAEIESHLAEAAGELRGQGLGEGEARERALARLGDLGKVAEALTAIHDDWWGGATVLQRIEGAALRWLLVVVGIGLLMMAGVAIVAGGAVGGWWLLLGPFFAAWFAGGARWLCLVSLAAAAAIWWHRRATDRDSAVIWAGAAVVLGPLSWLAYAALVWGGAIPRPEGRWRRRVLAVPVVSLAVVLLFASGAAGFLGALASLYTGRPADRSGQLSQSAPGVWVLLRAADSPVESVRQAAGGELRENVIGRPVAASQMQAWTRLLGSRYRETRAVGYDALATVSSFYTKQVSEAELTAAWRAALLNRDASIRRAAWMRLDIDVELGRPVAGRLRPHLPAFLAASAGESVEAVQSSRAGVARSLLAAGVKLDPEGLGFPDSQLARLLPLSGGIESFGMTTIGETQELRLGLPPQRIAPGQPPVQVTAARATGAELRVLGMEPGRRDPRTLVVRLAYTARGPEGLHETPVRLYAGGRLVGITQVAVGELSAEHAALPLVTTHTISGTVVGNRIPCRVDALPQDAALWRRVRSVATEGSQIISASLVEGTAGLPGGVEFTFQADLPLGPRVDWLHLLDERGRAVRHVAVFSYSRTLIQIVHEVNHPLAARTASVS